ncbi:FAD-dependent oxidoreductase [Rhodococcus koreensis]|uniref:FAD-dependent oxidoreductase n=1 Tax=Rhodococcus koreensis TaxID=99653 RepID=UPI001981FFB3|nr:FAD-dependent oxidoreductase [Rhodococcus koreensis]QSE86740.1 FAD-dependent oxidoreductase [Rhodococcus koreensis]
MSANSVVIVGGGMAGIGAALSCARLGIRSVLVSECEWLGGQVSSQAIPPDEHPWIEFAGCTHSYRTFRNNVRTFYTEHYPLTADARSARLLNPGGGNIGPLSHEPFVAEIVIEQMLAPWRSRGLIEIIRDARVVRADTTGDRVDSVTVELLDGTQREISGGYYIDATDLGDLIDAARIEHVVGAESQSQTGEPHALPGDPDPTDQQAITWALALRLSPDTDNIIERPTSYDFWRSYQPDFWPGPLLGWEVSDYVTHEPRHRPLFVTAPGPTGIRYDLWHARRVLAAENMDGDWTSDNTIAAWPMMDYMRLPLVGGDPEHRETALDEAREFTRSFLYWMQTEAPRHDGGVGYPELRPHTEITGTADGLAKRPYIREGRRIAALFTVAEQHIGVAARNGFDSAEHFDDSVGIGAYRMDLHPSTSGRNTLDLDTYPFQIPLGSLIPVRVRNVLAAGKTMGTTHLTNGAYRVHPVEWSAGEASGAVAAFCLGAGVEPAELRAKAELIADLQSLLTTRLGIDLEWPDFGPLTPTHRFGYVPTTSS